MAENTFTKQDLESALKKIAEIDNWVYHTDSCESYNTEVCTCGMVQARAKAREAFATIRQGFSQFIKE